MATFELKNNWQISEYHRQPAVETWPYALPSLPLNRYWEQPPDKQRDLSSSVHCMETSDLFDIYSYRATSILYNGRTAFQSITVAQTVNYGRILLLDGHIQSSEADEDLYHEMLVQPAMLIHPDPRDVLIIGGGEGATLREVVAHQSVKRVTMVDIDEEAVEVCKALLSSWHRGAFNDPRVRLRFADGREFIESAEELYDVVIVDVVDMLDNGPAQKLYTRQFYELVRKRLRSNGIVVVQGLEFSPLDYQGHAALMRTLRAVFSKVQSYSCCVPSFLAPWGFLIASDSIDLREFSENSIDSAIQRRLGPDWLVHLSGEYLFGSQRYSKETNFLLSLPGPILEDGILFIPQPDVGDTWPLEGKFPVLGD